MLEPAHYSLHSLLITHSLFFSKLLLTYTRLHCSVNPLGDQTAVSEYYSKRPYSMTRIVNRKRKKEFRQFFGVSPKSRSVRSGFVFKTKSEPKPKTKTNGFSVQKMKMSVGFGLVFCNYAENKIKCRFSVAKKRQTKTKNDFRFTILKHDTWHITHYTFYRYHSAGPENKLHLIFITEYNRLL